MKPFYQKNLTYDIHSALRSQLIVECLCVEIHKRLKLFSRLSHKNNKARFLLYVLTAPTRRISIIPNAFESNMSPTNTCKSSRYLKNG